MPLQDVQAPPGGGGAVVKAGGAKGPRSPRKTQKRSLETGGGPARTIASDAFPAGLFCLTRQDRHPRTPRQSLRLSTAAP